MTEKSGYVALVRDLRTLGRTNKAAEYLAPAAAKEIERLRERIEILEAEIRVMRKLRSFYDSRHP
jgi:hypothetical protein